VWVHVDVIDCFFSVIIFIVVGPSPPGLRQQEWERHWQGSGPVSALRR
jgi:hypothetical protein